MGDDRSLTVAALIEQRPRKHNLSIAISTIVLILATSVVEAQTTWFVDADGAAGGGCSSWADACPSLQTALGLANPGDMIWVATGTYMPDGGYTPVGGIHVAGSGDRSATVQLLNGVAIYGGFVGDEDPATFDLADRDFTANETILGGDLNGDDAPVADPADLPDEPTRAENSFHVVTGSGTDTTAILNGFTITGGNANVFFPDPSDNWGGGMLNTTGSPTISYCRFIGNASRSGGALLNNIGSNPVVNFCSFNDNEAFDGGGMSNSSSSSPVVTNCMFSGNVSRIGGGMTNGFDCNSIVSNCTFTVNSASLGGGMWNKSSSTPIVIDCLFSENTANWGGAMFNVIGASPIAINCTFSANVANVVSGGIWNQENASLFLINCVFHGNNAEWNGAITLFGNCYAYISHCTFTGNTAPNGSNAIGLDSPDQMIPNELVMNNCILRNGGGDIWNNDGSAMTVTHTNFEGGFPGTGNIDADPLFVDPLGPDGIAGTEDDDLRLMPGSPCIDAGDNASIPADIADLDGDGDTTEPTPIDLDGNPRIVNGTVDMGAYEVQVLDCNGNGVPDDQDIANGTSADCNENGIPDECDGFIDTTPPEIACSIAPAPEDDSEDSGDEGDDGNDEDAGQQSGSGSGQSSDHGRAGVTGLNQPTGAAVTLRDSGGEEIGTPGGGRDGDAISDEGYDGPIMILFDASDDCGEVTLSAIIDIGCMQIPVENGTVIDFDCNEGDDSGDCEAEEDDGILEIEAASAVMIVTATDESGNTSTCEIVLCSPPDDGSDDGSDDNEGDAGAASEGRLVPRPKARGPRLEEGGSASR